MSGGGWLRASETTTNVATFRPGGMSDEDDDDDIYDYYDDDDFDGRGEEGHPNDVNTGVSNTQPLPKVHLVHPLRFAIAVGTRDEVLSEIRKLKEEGFDLNTPLHDQWSALLYACHVGRVDIIEILLGEGADPLNHSIDFENGFIALACSPNEKAEEIIECAKILLSHGLDLNERESDLHAAPLHFAVKNEKLELIDFFCANGANVNILDKRKATPLYWAASRGLCSVVKKLLEHGADVSVISSGGLCAYEVAAFNGFPKLAKKLYLYGKAEHKNTVDFRSLPDVEVSDADVTLRQSGGFAERDYVGDILLFLKLRRYSPYFRKRGIKLPEFLQLRDDDLVALGITAMGDRIKLMDAIRQIHNHDWKSNSLVSFPSGKITSSEALSMCDNFDSHLKLMSATIKNLRDHARVPAEKSCLLNPGLEKKEPERIREYCGKLVTAVRSLIAAAGEFGGVIQKVKDDESFNVGDLIRD